jgi:hypothetical protein
MGTNEKKTGAQDSSNQNTGGRNDPPGTTASDKSAGTSGHSPEFGKVSGSAGAGGSQSSTSQGDPMKPSGLRGKSTGGAQRDDGSIEGGTTDAEGTDASGNRRSDSISGMFDSGNKSPAQGKSASPDPNAGTPGKH